MIEEEDFTEWLLERYSHGTFKIEDAEYVIKFGDSVAYDLYNEYLDTLCYVSQKSMAINSCKEFLRILEIRKRNAEHLKNLEIDKEYYGLIQ